MNVQATFAATLVDEWVRAGLRHAVVAPGSRSTPLVLALADAAEAGRLRLHVHLDERSGAFFALGLGIATRRPAVVVTTSGTAAVEAHPAVIEAYHAGVPLLVCTADRPRELHDVGAPQTIEQDRLYGGAVRWFCAPGVPEDASASSWRSLAARAVAEAHLGPVHLNLAFRDPLIGEPGPLPPGRPSEEPWHTNSPAAAEVGLDGLGTLLRARQGLIVAGRGVGDPTAVAALAEVAGWPVFADPLSGCRQPLETTVGAFDALLRHRGFRDRHRPDAVLRLGAPPASKVLASWLASLDVPQVVVAEQGWLDPEHKACVLVPAAPEATCWPLAEVVEAAEPGWSRSWAEAEGVAQEAFDEILAAQEEPTEPGMARAVFDTVPAGTRLVVASSMPVRDVEWYSRPRLGLQVIANRGANGIDGLVSSALGVAAAGGPVVALMGDLAFLHDVGGLVGAAGRETSCVFVVVDNDGGGIFSFLPQARFLPRDRFEWLFATPHHVDLEALARVHRIPVTAAKRAVEVGPALLESVEAGGLQMVHVRTDRAANVEVHRALNAAVASGLEGRGLG